MTLSTTKTSSLTVANASSDRVSTIIRRKTLCTDQRVGEKKFSKITKFSNANGEEVIDLDHSVFMNFQHFSENNMDECFTND